MIEFNYEGADDIERAWREGLTPDPLLTVSEWADRHRILSSKASAEPGRWRTARTPYLREILDCLSPTSPVERVVFMKGAQVGAPLALDTPIPTPEGWSTMGQLSPGDYVFGADGWPCKVTGVSPVLEDQPCYRVLFEDGQAVVCDAAHLWCVWDFTNDVPQARTLRTEQMIGRLKLGQSKRFRYAVDLCKGVELPPEPLLIHPYVLGVWLGDGSSAMNHISVHEDDEEIAQHLNACGVNAVFRLPTWRKGRCANVIIDPTCRTIGEDRLPLAGSGRSSFTTRLRLLDLLDNKHIPQAYLRAGHQQRLALVQGLMDTDGTISADGKTCTFSNVDRNLIDGLVELLHSLGYKPSVSSRPGKLDRFREQGWTASQEHWRVTWTAYAEEPMFRLSRKLARMRSVDKGLPARSRRRRVVDIQPVASVPVRCIAVDSSDHLFLCGKGWIPTHNTEAGSNWIGYVIHHAPGPMMAVWPTVDMAKRNSKQRIDPLVEETPALAELIAPARSRDAGNTVLAKEFRGGVLVMTGANSAVGLRSMPVRYLFLDEVDGYPLDVEGEGDAISLAEARTRTFARRKIFIVSTPTIAGASTIEREYEASDQRRYFLPCPHCGHSQWLRFERLRWEHGRPHTAAYVCEGCEEPIPEHHKTWMLERGQWRPTVTGGARRTAGFHLSSLYSPIGWRSWRDIAAAWESATAKESRSSAAIKTFKNTELGETWVEDGEAPDWQRLLERRESYRVGTVPWGGLLLVAGADVQKDRIEVSVWAWGRGKESWLIEHRVLMGDTDLAGVWQQLGAMLNETWTHESGVQMPLAKLALDTGFQTQEAYAFVRSCHDSRVMAVKGVSKGAALIGTPTAVDVTAGGRRLRRGMKVFSVVVGIAKQELYSNLRKVPSVDGSTGEIVYPPGYVHLPAMDAEYLQQLCAEQLVTRRDRNGFPVREWQKMRERNEGLDCFNYARAAAAACGLDRFEERQWRELERPFSEVVPSPRPVSDGSPPDPFSPAPPEATNPGGFGASGPPRRVRRVVKSRWLSR
ncbi:phage terminase large subunit family protein [Aquabacterium sp. A7-Y]|uniref:terminase gpA endonuclease subunit n=1 Tax=Aquabacterium sp. A7-Y TaxID=1349605 RepID=UPI00223E8A18|nr:terminase gpA endonuclease subunit [Aquabacterium sp. A7-Y]MCW7542096.1 phage terminase large subunit family protein [Aquabacterium sp. A7-Y]